MSTISSDVYINPTAVVEDNVSIGSGTKVWHHCHIREGAKIGENCVLGKNVYIDKGVVIGNGVKIQNNVSVYKGITLEDDVFIGPLAIFTNDPYPRAFLDWGDDKIVETIIRKGASIGAGSAIRCGIEIGKYAMIGMGAVITREVKPYELWIGNPAKLVGIVNKEGKRT
ncbi:MAG: N-acetyltransferase [Fibrobacter sp.]|nr:N-acetyltransferase [Fibrobacter sp.]